jgi:hypothetical protein
MRRIALVLLLVVGLAVGLSRPADAKTQDPTKAGEAWLKALFATGSANDAQAALRLAAAGTPAYSFTAHQIGALKAQAGSGAGGNSNSVKAKGRNVRLCQETLRGDDCITFARFEIDKTGRVENFSYTDDKKLSELVPPVLGTGQSGSAFGVTFRLASYFQARDALIVILDATGAADGARTVESYQATYQPPNGPAVQASTSLGLTGDIQPGVAATVELQFPGMPASGGTVTIPMLSGPPNYSTGSATISLA